MSYDINLELWDERASNVGEGQVAIGPAHPRQRVTRDRGVKVNNLHEPMHACIGTSGAQRTGLWSSGKGLQRGFQLILDSVAVRLTLPAVVRTAIVTDAQRHPLERRRARCSGFDGHKSRSLALREVTSLISRCLTGP